MNGALSFANAVGRVTSILCIPYGYTVSTAFRAWRQKALASGVATIV